MAGAEGEDGPDLPSAAFLWLEKTRRARDNNLGGEYVSWRGIGRYPDLDWEVTLS
jgi:hypothetical protein